MNKLYPIHAQSQQNKFANNPSVEYVLMHPEIIEGLKPSQLAALNYSIWLDNINRIQFASQTHIGTKSTNYKDDGYVRETINRAYKQLHQDGLVCVYNRGVKKTCVVEVNPLFRDFGIRERFKKLLPALNFFSMFVVFAAYANYYQQHDVTHNFKKEVFYKEVNRHTAVERQRRREEGTAFRPESKKKREKVMNIPETSPIRAKIYQELKLTEAGKLELLCFNDHVLSVVYNQFKQQSGVSNAYKWIFDQCELYAKEKKIRIDWPLFYHVKEKHGITKQTPKIEKKPEVTGRKPVYQSAPQRPIRSTIEIASSIKEIDTEKQRAALASFMGRSSAEETVTKYIHGYTKEEYTTPTTPEELEALAFIDAWKLRLSPLEQIVDTKVPEEKPLAPRVQSLADMIKVLV